MPLNLATGAELVGNQVFQYRVAMAFYFVARQVFDEDPATENHKDRIIFARNIVIQGYNQFLQYAAVIATDDDIVAGGPYPDPTSAPNDSLIIAAVTSVWDRLASVRLL